MSDSDALEPVIRVAHSPSPGGKRPERHLYRSLDGDLWAIAMCQHTSLAAELDQDDPNVPMCPLCNVFRIALEVDVEQLDTDSDWKGL